MTKLHTSYIPSATGLELEEITYKFGEVKIMPNDHLLWQVRLCSEPGIVKVIAAFEDKNDAVTFMSLISKHKGHGEKISLKEKVYGCGIEKENEEEQKKHGCDSYSIEHNTNEFDEVL